jgi:hypothetical protein
LPLNYPRMPPQCRMLTPIFHPNIAPHAICIGDHWSPGEPLWSIVARIGELIAYQSYNTKSPLNGEAARWVDENLDQVPLDPVSMMPDDAGSEPRRAPSPHASARPPKAAPVSTGLRQSPPSTAVAPSPTEPLQVECPGCKARLRFAREHAGRQVRCPRCHEVLRAPAS